MQVLQPDAHLHLEALQPDRRAALLRKSLPCQSCHQSLLQWLALLPAHRAVCSRKFPGYKGKLVDSRYGLRKVDSKCMLARTGRKGACRNVMPSCGSSMGQAGCSSRSLAALSAAMAM